MMKKKKSKKVQTNVKVCGRCQEPKPVSEFQVDRSRKDGCRIYCKACDHERMLKKKAEIIGIAPSLKTDPNVKLCRRCKTEKPTSEFHKDAKRKDGVGYYCKTCERDRKRDARAAARGAKSSVSTPSTRLILPESGETAGRGKSDSRTPVPAATPVDKKASLQALLTRLDAVTKTRRDLVSKIEALVGQIVSDS